MRNNARATDGRGPARHRHPRRERRRVSNQTRERGADLVLSETRSELHGEFDDAPWITLAQREALLKSLDELEAQPDRTTDAFGKAADALATQIEETFGAAQE